MISRSRRIGTVIASVVATTTYGIAVGQLIEQIPLIPALFVFQVI